MLWPVSPGCALADRRWQSRLSFDGRTKDQPPKQQEALTVSGFVRKATDTATVSPTAVFEHATAQSAVDGQDTSVGRSSSTFQLVRCFEIGYPRLDMSPAALVQDLSIAATAAVSGTVVYQTPKVQPPDTSSSIPDARSVPLSLPVHAMYRHWDHYFPTRPDDTQGSRYIRVS